MKRIGLAMGLTMLFIVCGGTASAENDAAKLLRYVPGNVECVIGVNVREVAGSGAFAEFKKRMDPTNRLDAFATIIQSLAGVNPFEDIQAGTEAISLSANAACGDAASATLFKDVMTGLIAVCRLHDDGSLQFDSSVTSEGPRLMASLDVSTDRVIAFLQAQQAAEARQALAAAVDAPGE